MELGVIGDGPAVEAIIAATSDRSLSVRRIDADALTDDQKHDDAAFPETGAVVAPAGAPVFGRANDVFGRWVAVETGGLGGQPKADIHAAVSTFGPESACYGCLQTRVAAHSDGGAAEPTSAPATVRLAGAIAGHRLLSLCDGDAAGGRVREVPGADRTLLPVPNCECTSRSPDDTFGLQYREVEVEAALARAEQAVDDRLGLLATVGERESFPVPYYIAELGDTTGFSDADAADFAAGVDTDWDRAYMKAIGEGLERYSAGVYRTADATTGSVETVTNPIPPRRFVRPDCSETLSPDETIQWVPGKALPDGAAVSLPADLVRFPPTSQRFRPSITTGLAVGNSTVEAVLGGLYETIERDATMLGWYSTFEPLGLAVEDDHLAELDQLAGLHQRAQAKSLNISLLLVTQDIDVPVVAAGVHREAEWPQFAAGSAANLDPVAAARSALAEALQNWMELRAMGPEAAAAQGGAIAEYADFPPAAQAFVDPEQTVSPDSLGEPALSGRAELDAVCDRLSAVDLDAYAARITTRDVATLGFEAVRVLVPAAQPLFTGDAYFGERARQVPASMGFEPRLDRAYHPYP
ncbi:MAG: thiazole/oxazole-forming peptide maturase, SagD family component [uncultured archaeon A07HN63]|nr:MAG: thiazole/oxazole-forming peptide maturase, SagD family component [uncultured archaeon A07HN63]